MSSLAWCWPQSVVPGDAVDVHASAGSGSVDVEVVRDGASPSVVWSTTGVAVDDLPVPDDAPEAGCPWPVTCTVPTGDRWRSGLYLVRLRRSGTASWDPPSAFFVVRSPQPTTRGVLLVLATNTWNAYNDLGGRNLYTGAVEVSFARPLAAGMLAKPSGPGERVVNTPEYLDYTAEHGLSSWHAMAGWAGQERRFAAWAEQEDVELAYAVNSDVESVPGLLDGQRLVVSVGHDEYWTWGMRDAIEDFVADGGNVAFLSGNTCYWQVRVEGRRMVSWKHRFAEDPVHGTNQAHLTTTMWADPIVGRPEATLTGVTFTRGGYHRVHRSVPQGTGAYEVHRPDHWLLAGTRLRRGDLLGAAARVVGYECDGCELRLVDGLPVPTGVGGTPASFEVVATAPATPFDAGTTPLPLPEGGRPELEFHAERLLGDDSPEHCDRLRNGHAVLGCYERGGTVVTVGCTDWAFGLDSDPTVAQVTRNILDRMAPTP